MDTNIHTHTYSYIKNIPALERVQKYFTKNLRGLENMLYKQRLAILNQLSLELRRLRTDLIFLYKILQGLVDSNLKGLFNTVSHVSTCNLSLHGHAYKLHVPKPCTDLLKFSYQCRVVTNWNSMPFELCAVKSLPLFKQRLTIYVILISSYFVCSLHTFTCTACV